MAEQGLKINIGADVTDLQTSLEKVKRDLVNFGYSIDKISDKKFPSLFDLTTSRGVKQFAEDAKDAEVAVRGFQGAIVGINQKGFPTLYEFVNNRRPQLRAFNDSLGDLGASAVSAGNNIQRVRPTFVALGQTLRDAGNFAISTQIGLVAISNNLPGVVDEFSRFRQQLQATSGASVSFASALRQFATGFIGPTGLITLIGTAVTVLPILAGRLLQSKSASDKAKESTKDFSDTLKSINSQIAGEATRVTELLSVLRSEVETRERKKGALSELKRINSAYFGQLKEEKGLINGLETAYQNYIASLFDLGRAQAASKKVQELFTQLLDIEQRLGRNQIQGIVDPKLQVRITETADKLKELGIDVRNLTGNIANLTPEQSKLLRQYTDLTRGVRQFDVDGTTIALRKQRDEIEKQILALSKLSSANSRFINVSQQELNSAAEELSNVNVPGSLQTVEINTQIKFSDLTLESARKAFESLPKLAEKTINNTPITFRPKINPSQQVLDNIEAFKQLGRETQSVVTQFNDFLAPAINTVFGALENGQSIPKAIGQAFKALIVQITATIAKAAILAAILNAIFPGGAAIGGAAVKGFGSIFGALLGGGNVAAPSFGGIQGGGFNFGGQVLLTARGTDLVGVLNAGQNTIRRVG